jgi:peptidoglycan/LPS O-acetylase OafA/YrhL
MVAKSEKIAVVSTGHRIPSLDGLRAVSILAVLASHYIVVPQTTFFGLVVESIGSPGVHCFFVISGFLITTLLLQESSSTGSVSLKEFYLRRAFRILPAAYLYLAIAFAAIEFGLFHPSDDRQALILAPIFLENYVTHVVWIVGHFWTLSVEEQFYLLWPFLYVALVQRNRLRVLVGVIIGVPVINLVIIRFGLPFWGRAFYSLADTLAIGCLLAVFARDARILGWLHKVVDHPLFWLILLPYVTFILIDSVHLNLVLSIAKTLVFRPFANVAIALIIFRLVTRPTAFFNNPPVTYLGRISYSLYLWQQMFCRDPRIPGLVGLACAFLCAIFSYHLVELPFLKIRKKLMHRQNRVRVA